MKAANYGICLVLLLLLSSCTQRSGYEMFRQMGYRECLKRSLRPAEDCRYAPDFDIYQQELLRDPENK